MNIVDLIVRALIGIVLFVVLRWAIPVLFGVLSVSIPEQVSTALAFGIALAVAYWGALPARWPWQKSA